MHLHKLLHVGVGFVNGKASSLDDLHLLESQGAPHPHTPCPAWDQCLFVKQSSYSAILMYIMYIGSLVANWMVFHMTTRYSGNQMWSCSLIAESPNISDFHWLRMDSIFDDHLTESKCPALSRACDKY